MISYVGNRDRNTRLSPPRGQGFIVLLRLVNTFSIFLASGGLIQLLKDGGAREQGTINVLQYSGPLEHLPKLWGVVAVLVLTLALLQLPKLKLRPDWAWSGLIAFSALSAIWSEYPRAAIVSSALIALAYAALLLQARLLGLDSVLKTFDGVIIGLVLSSCFFASVLPSHGVSVGEHAGRWQGVFDHKNSLGNFSAFAIIYLVWRLGKRRGLILGAAIACALVLLVRSESMTALGGLLIAAFASLTLRRPLSAGRPSRYLHNLFVLCVFAAAGSVVYIAALDMSQTFWTRDLTFTNRNLIWFYFGSEILQHPFIGAGFNQFATSVVESGDDFKAVVGFLVGSAHNGFIEIAYSLGAAGAFLAIFGLVRRPNVNVASVYYPFLAYYVALNCFESRFFGFNIFFLFVLLLSSQRARNDAQIHFGSVRKNLIAEK